MNTCYLRSYNLGRCYVLGCFHEYGPGQDVFKSGRLSIFIRIAPFMFISRRIAYLMVITPLDGQFVSSINLLIAMRRSCLVLL